MNTTFNVLNDAQLVDINGGNCFTETLGQHPIKVALFGTIYIAAVAYGCYA